MSRLLIVEDDAVVANIYRNKFAADGYTVEVVGEAEQALELLTHFKPAVILLDLVLPKMNGVDFIKAVRAQGEFKDLPVVVFSNTYLANLVQDARKAGATKCLAKANYTPRQIVDIIKGVIAAPVTSTGTTSPNSEGELGKTAVAAAPGQPTRGAITSSNPDAEFQADLRTSFISTLPAALQEIRGLLKQLIKASTEIERVEEIHLLYRRIHALTGNAGVSGMFLIAQVSDALEALLKELYEKPKSINPSTLRTVAMAVDFLGVLFHKGALPDHKEVPPSKILVVDDETISRRAVVYALEKAKLQAVNVGDPNLAYSLLEGNQFDLIFLDVDMPGMTGFELCAKLRKLPGHKRTPVVFVTNLNDFEHRTNSTISGGNDFIGKPFLFIELAVKALIYVLRNRLD